jgi:sulfite reductase alpha subunit-like flavoprotein
MQPEILAFLRERYIVKSNNTNLKNSNLAASNKLNSSKTRLVLVIILLVSFTLLNGCGIYSFSGASTAAKTLTVEQFFNNTDLGPANVGQNFTNKLKDYYQRNSSLKVVPENGELQVDGAISEYRINPIAPVASGNQTIDAAALTRLTIGVKMSYVDTLEPKNSFKDRTFSFYADFPNTEILTNVQEELEKKIFDQILTDIFNATVANW